MQRRQFLKHSVWGTLGMNLVRGSSVQAAEKDHTHNFLIILTDDQTYRAIGYTNPLVQTPNLDRLANEGMIFENAYVASPICVASRASLLTGVFPQQHGSVGLDADGFHKSVVETPHLQTLAQALSAKGYQTGFAGKSHLGPPHEYGFSEGDENHDPNDQESFVWATSFLRKCAVNRTPFLLWLAVRQPHIPLLPSDKWLELYQDSKIQVDPNFLESPPEGSLYNQGLPGERLYRDSEHTKNYQGLRAGPPRSREEILSFMKAYYATISHLDSQVGMLEKVLNETGLSENTILIFLSDNGYHLGNHGLGNKITMHEESVHVPMFINWHSLPHKGVRCQELVSSLDLFPTLLELAGIDQMDRIEGQSLVPLCANPGNPIRDYVFSECVGVGGTQGMGHRMIRSKQWKYILTDKCEEALFDEIEDPYELRNLASLSGCTETLKLMRSEMGKWMTRIGDSHPPPPST